MSQSIGTHALAAPTLTAILVLDRFGKPMATLTSRLFCDVEMHPDQMRSLARLLNRMADTTEGYRPVVCGRCAITLTTEEA